MDQLSGTILSSFKEQQTTFIVCMQTIAEEAVGGDIATIPNSKAELAQLIVKKLQEIYTSPIAIEGRFSTRKCSRAIDAGSNPKKRK